MGTVKELKKNLSEKDVSSIICYCISLHTAYLPPLNTK